MKKRVVYLPYLMRLTDVERANLDLHMVTFMGLPSSEESLKVTFVSILSDFHVYLTTGGVKEYRDYRIARLTPLAWRFLVVIGKFSRFVQFPEEYMHGVEMAVKNDDVVDLIHYIRQGAEALQV